MLSKQRTVDVHKYAQIVHCVEMTWFERNTVYDPVLLKFTVPNSLYSDHFEWKRVHISKDCIFMKSMYTKLTF